MTAKKDIDKNRIVGTLYDEYVKAVYTSPEPMLDWQEVQIQAAFYAGIFAILGFLDDNADDGDEITEADFDLMQSIHTELQRHQKIIVKRMLKYWEEPHS